MALTDRYILNLKPTGKSSKHFDGGGKYLFPSARTDTRPMSDNTERNRKGRGR